MRVRRPDFYQLKLHALGQRAIHHQIGTGYKTRCRTGKEGDRIGHLLRCAHASGRVHAQCFFEQRRIALLDLIPYAAGKVGIAR